MSQIDSIGSYRARIVESGLGLTKKDYPQWVAKFEAVEKWVDDPGEMKHFGLGEPAWVEWSEYGDTITGFFCLFNDADTYDETTKLLNYDQVQTATGWDGTEFESLNNGSFDGQVVMIRVAENTYEGNTRLQVEWIDGKDASPVRELRKLDDDKLKSLAGKLKIKKKTKPSTAAKPVSKPVTKPSTKPAEGEEPSVQKTPSAKTAPPKKANEAPATGSKLPPKTTQADAWDVVTSNKGGNSDGDIEEAWMAACNEVGEDRDDSTFTEEDWAKVRDIVIRDLALDVAA